MHEGDQLERELGFGPAVVLLVLNQIGDGEFLAFDLKRKIRFDARLGEHGEELTGVSLHARPNPCVQLAAGEVRKNCGQVHGRELGLACDQRDQRGTRALIRQVNRIEVRHRL